MNTKLIMELNKVVIKNLIKTLSLDILIIISYFLKKSKKNRNCNFAIGLPRSGTHSVASILKDGIRVSHEPLVGETAKYILRYKHGKISRKHLIRYFRYREDKINIDLEAAHYLHHVVDVLVEIYPKSKYILTVREPLSWLESEMGKNIRTYNKGHYADKMLRAYRYGKYNNSFSSNEKPIAGVYPIESYFTYWKDHLEYVLKAVPGNRLLIMHTNEISNNIKLISNFINIKLEENEVNSHSDKLNRESLKLDKIANKKDYIIPMIESELLVFIKTNFSFLLKEMPYINK